jgi:hypothetical protein
MRAMIIRLSLLTQKMHQSFAGRVDGLDGILQAYRLVVQRNAVRENNK